MWAIRQYSFGDPSVLQYEEVPSPVPGPDQVLIEVEACGVHLIDASLRAGDASGPPLPSLPTTPGREVAGVVSAGPAAWIGRRVVAHLGTAGGGYASQAVAPVASLHTVSLPFPSAVALIGTGRTAVAILELASIGPSDVVLVTGAAGGLGILLAQAARQAGAYVIGLASSPKLPHVIADAAVVHGAPLPRPPTVLLDGVGGAPGRAAFEQVAVGGRVVLYGWAAGAPFDLTAWDLYRQGITISCAIGPRMAARPLRDRETEALARDWTPAVTTFPLSEAAEAHRAMTARHTIGKTVLIP